MKEKMNDVLNRILHRKVQEMPHTKRLQKVLSRNLIALCLTLVLVMMDAIPVPNGIPDTIEAAGPRKGTITFYKWTRYDTREELPSSSDYVMIIYKNGKGEYRYMDSVGKISGNQWPSLAVSVDPKINPEAKEFMTRTRWTNYYIKRTSDGRYYIYESCDGTRYSVSNSTVELIRTTGATSWFNMRLQSTGWFDSYYKTKNNNDTWLRVRDTCLVQHKDGGTACNWEIYKMTKVPFTCINKDYEIGKDQVYTAESDLILQEGVKLKIPEGAVLCVKKGTFFVNGEIECSGTILVEDGGVIEPIESTAGGSRIVLKEGGTMIIRDGGRVYAGCPKGSLGTKGDQGCLYMYNDSHIINYGLLVAGKCEFFYGAAALENHKGATMYLGYSVEDEHKFLYNSYAGASAESLGLSKAGGMVSYGQEIYRTVLKVWDGATTTTANNLADKLGKRPIKLYSYDEDGKCTVSEYTPQ